jgi:S1-C subfamily serine protease
VAPAWRLALVGGVAALTLGHFAFAAAEEPRVLKEDTPFSGVIDVQTKEMLKFRVEVPKDAVLMTARITQCPLMLDILARRGEAPTSTEDADQLSSTDVLDPALRISRESNPPLTGGTYYLGVSYLSTVRAIVHKRPAKKVPFTLRLSFVRSKVEAVLVPGQRTAGQIRAADGSMRIYAIDVPADAKVLRIDLDGVSSDLDLFARLGQPVLANEEAEATAVSPLGRETLLVERAPQGVLKPGRWFISVLHPADYGTVDFAIYARFSADPPPELLVIPQLAATDDPRKRAIAATVDVSTEIDGASGTLVSPTGLVLTNYHVVTEVVQTPGEKDAVVIAATIDPHEPPRELFRGDVIVADRSLDLALVQITCGLYRQPLPPGYRFPWIPLADSRSVQIGDTVYVLGFPSIGGTVGRVSLTMTQGVLSGFERTAIGTLMKTDAAISPGNSGGAAMDGRWTLIGVPTFENVSPEAVSRMSYVHPVELIPKSWLAMIRQQQAGKP